MKRGGAEQGPIHTHPFDKRSGKSPNNHHHLAEGNREFIPELKTDTLSVNIAVGGSPHIDTTAASVSTPFHKDGPNGQSITLRTVEHKFTKPLTPLFVYRNGRVGGGGTSREALKRAKRRIKKHGKGLKSPTPYISEQKSSW